MADDGAGRAAAIRHGGGGGGHGARAQEELLQEVPVRMIYLIFTATLDVAVLITVTVLLLL